MYFILPRYDYPIIIVIKYLFLFYILSFSLHLTMFVHCLSMLLNLHACICVDYFLFELVLFLYSFHHALGIVYQLILSATLGLTLWGGSGWNWESSCLV